MRPCYDLDEKRAREEAGATFLTKKKPNPNYRHDLCL